MNKFLSVIKKNKRMVIITAVIVIISLGMIFTFYKIYKFLSPNYRNSVYGDRCELTESIIITDARKQAIKEAVEGHEGMTLSSVNVKCNLVDIIVIVKDDIAVEKVKEMSKDIIAVFTTEELKYYDLELMVDSDLENSEVYPIIGVKHKVIQGQSRDYFVW